MAETYQVLQYVSIPLTFIFMFVCCVLPWTLKNYKNAASYMSIASCFGAGVILGAAFSHMVPEAMENFEHYFGEENESSTAKYPWPMFISIVALLLLITIDTVAHSAHGNMMGEHHNHSHGDAGHSNHLAAIFNDKPKKQTSQVELSKKDDAVLKIENQETKPQPDQVIVASTLNLDHVESDSNKKCESESKSTSSEVLVRGTKSQVVQAYIFFIALSLHAITDGLSIGAGEEGSTGFYGILIAVIAHKALDGFALGVPLFYAKLPKLHTIFLILFCCAMTPLGIGIGIAATQSVSSKNSDLAKGIVLSISMGSFIFITLWEMLPAALNQGKHLGVKLIATFLGWGLMALLAVWV